MKFQEYILVHLSLVLLCAKLTLLWVLANYTYPSDPAVGTGKKADAVWPREAGSLWSWQEAWRWPV